MNTIKERIKIVLNAYRFSVSKLAGGYCNGTQTKLNRQINGDSMVTCDTLEHILTTFPNVSAEWLMRGEGTMYKMDHGSTRASEKPYTPLPTSPQPPQLPQTPIEEKDKNLEEIIALQKDAILQRDKRIELLESLLGAYRSGSLA